MTLRDALNAVHKKHGMLTPQLVVDEARKARSSAGKLLHDRLEWDDSVAGEAFRRHQAQELIRSVKVTYRKADDADGEITVRAFHAVRNENGHVYEPVEKVVDDPFTSRLVLAEMEREWRQLKERYESFAEFTAMVRRDLGLDEQAA
jgi:hypothetical protein